MQVKKITDLSEIKIAHEIRMKVFVEEQNCPLEEEIDEIDSSCTHFLLYNSNHEALGTARLVPPMKGSDESECHLGRLAVLKEARGKGLGKLLVEAVHNEARLQGATSQWQISSIHGQSYAVPFYEKMGYQIDENDQPFFECGIEHYHMICHL